MDRQSLTERIARARGAETVFLPAFTMYTEDYFEGLAKLEGTSYFREKYRSEIAAYAAAQGELLLDEFAAAADSLPAEEKISVLYAVLAEPFLYMERKGRRTQNSREDGALWQYRQ